MNALIATLHTNLKHQIIWLFTVHEGAGFWKMPAIRLSIWFSLSGLAFYGLLWYGRNYDQEAPGKYYNDKRDYQKMPFDIIDALAVCKQKTQVRYGEMLVRAYVDSHSTRFENRAGIYKVFVFAHIGTRQIYDEAMVHCFVDPDEYMVTHYRVFEPEKASLMSRAWNAITN